MNIYFRCCKCDHQWTASGNVTAFECQKCGGNTLDMEMGNSSPPTWWSSDRPKSVIDAAKGWIFGRSSQKGTA